MNSPVEYDGPVAAIHVEEGRVDDAPSQGDAHADLGEPVEDLGSHPQLPLLLRVSLLPRRPFPFAVLLSYRPSTFDTTKTI